MSSLDPPGQGDEPIALGFERGQQPSAAFVRIGARSAHAGADRGVRRGDGPAPATGRCPPSGPPGVQPRLLITRVYASGLRPIAAGSWVQPQTWRPRSAIGGVR